MNRDDGDILGEMIVEAKENLSSFEPNILLLEKEDSEVDSKEILNKLFRSMHSIKGAFGFFNFKNIPDLANSMENLLAKLREDSLSISKEIIDILLTGSDKISELIDNTKESDNIIIEEILEDLEKQIKKNNVEKKIENNYDLVIENTKSIKGKKNRKVNVEILRVKVDLLNNLMDLAGELVLARNQVINQMKRKTLEILGKERFERWFKEMSGRIQEVMDEVFLKVPGSNSGNKDLNLNMTETIGQEMIFFKKEFIQLLSTPFSDIPSVKSVLHQIDLVTSDIQGNIMGTRLQKLDSVFSKMPRIVRDMSNKLHKNVKIKISGEWVEVDKSIIEAISDPLTHILRNSLDHGIEVPSQREKAGKPEHGIIKLSAANEGEQVVIHISDDGSGFDLEAIKKKAIEKKIISSEQLEKMNDDELQRLIFYPGFSTSKVVSDISGRGVGMDVVKTNIEKLGGYVEVNSTKGVGSSIKLKIPLTMAIIPSLLVSVGDKKFAVPQNSLEDLVRIRPEEVAKRIETVEGSPVIRRRGKLLPLVRLADILGQDKKYKESETGELKADRRSRIVDRRKENETDINEDAPNEFKNRSGIDRRHSSKSAMQIIVLKVGINNFGLIVDRLLDHEEIVVKPLSSYIKDCKCYNGVTILADGKVATILDPAGIAEYGKIKFTNIKKEAEHKNAKRLIEGKKEIQEMLLFKNATEELFAIPIYMISRINKIELSDIDHVDKKEFIRYKDKSLRIIRMHNFLPIASPEKNEEDNFFVIIPKLVKHPIGIVATKVLDVIRANISLDREKIKGRGILGSSIIGKDLIIIIDIFSLMQLADPDLYKNSWQEKLKGKRILLADNNEYYRKTIQYYFEDVGCIVETVSSGEEALNYYNSKEEFDLIIVDMELPGLNGLELNKKIYNSKIKKALPVMGLYTFIAKYDHKQLNNEGLSAYESKVDKEKLLERAIEILGGSNKNGN